MKKLPIVAFIYFSFPLHPYGPEVKINYEYIWSPWNDILCSWNCILTKQKKHINQVIYNLWMALPSLTKTIEIISHHLHEIQIHQYSLYALNTCILCKSQGQLWWGIDSCSSTSVTFQYLLILFTRSNFLTNGSHHFIAQNHSLILYIDPFFLKKVEKHNQRYLKSEKYVPNFYAFWCFLVVGS